MAKNQISPITLLLVGIFAFSAASADSGCRIFETKIPPYYSIKYSPSENAPELMKEVYYAPYTYKKKLYKTVYSRIKKENRTVENISPLSTDYDVERSKSYGAPSWKKTEKPNRYISRGSLVKLAGFNKTLLQFFETPYSEIKGNICLRANVDVIYTERSQAPFIWEIYKTPSLLVDESYFGNVCHRSLDLPKKYDVLYLEDDIRWTYPSSKPDVFGFAHIPKGHFLQPHVNRNEKYVGRVCGNNVEYLFDKLDKRPLDLQSETQVFIPMQHFNNVRPISRKEIESFIDIRRIMEIEESEYANGPIRIDTEYTLDRHKCTPDGRCQIPIHLDQDVLKKVGWDQKTPLGYNSDVAGIGPSLKSMCYIHYTNDRPVQFDKGLTSALWMNRDLIPTAIHFLCDWKSYCNKKNETSRTVLECRNDFYQREKKCVEIAGFDYEKYREFSELGDIELRIQNVQDKISKLEKEHKTRLSNFNYINNQLKEVKSEVKWYSPTSKKSHAHISHLAGLATEQLSSVQKLLEKAKTRLQYLESGKEEFVQAVQASSNCKIVAESDLSRCMEETTDVDTMCVPQLGDIAHPTIAWASHVGSNKSKGVNNHQTHIYGDAIDIRLFSKQGLIAPKSINDINHAMTAEFICRTWSDPTVDFVIIDYKGLKFKHDEPDQQSQRVSYYDYLKNSKRCFISEDERKRVFEWIDYQYKINPRQFNSHDNHIHIKFKSETDHNVD